MNIGFALYGILMLVAAVETYRHAVQKQFDRHRVWALRLFALAIGSWLYRMDYGFWFMLSGGLGHTKGFQGPFDQIMAFFFYIPNLLIVEMIIRSENRRISDFSKMMISLVLLLASLFLATGTYFFTVHYWGPAIINWLTF